jgi:hypothetical protein
MPSTSSRWGQTYAVLRRGRLFVTVDRRPYSLAPHHDELRQAGAAWLRVDLTLGPERAEERQALWRSLRAGEEPRGAHDGNYRRGVL